MKQGCCKCRTDQAGAPLGRLPDVTAGAPNLLAADNSVSALDTSDDDTLEQAEEPETAPHEETGDDDQDEEADAPSTPSNIASDVLDCSTQEPIPDEIVCASLGQFLRDQLAKFASANTTPPPWILQMALPTELTAPSGSSSRRGLPSSRRQMRRRPHCCCCRLIKIPSVS